MTDPIRGKLIESYIFDDATWDYSAARIANYSADKKHQEWIKEKDIIFDEIVKSLMIPREFIN